MNKSIEVIILAAADRNTEAYNAMILNRVIASIPANERKLK